MPAENILQIQDLKKYFGSIRAVEQLVLSQKTVKGHVSNILSKLHLADRTQPAVYAWREGIVRRDP